MYRLVNPHFSSEEIFTISAISVIRNGIDTIDEIYNTEEKMRQFYIKNRKRIRASLNAHLNDDLKFMEISRMFKKEEVKDKFGKSTWYSLQPNYKRRYGIIVSEIMTELEDIIDDDIKRYFMHRLIRVYVEKLLA